MVRELQPGDPQTIGPYRLVGQLGGGGMGRVFLGVSAGGRPVAVKVIRAELAADPEFRMRFGREVAAARRVSGVFTAMVVDADVDGPSAWLATAYVPGPSLAEAIAEHGPLPAGSLLTLAAGLAESLSAIHAAGVVHRDLKPSNVLIAEDGPRVIDFGISRAAESTALTQAGLVIGSPGFMSPEQAMGYEVGQPSDIFSLGAVLAFAATGEGPFGAGTTAALLYRVVHGSPGLDQVPTEVRPLIERCLAKDPSQRPTAAGLLADVGGPPADGELAARIDHPRVRPGGPVRSRVRHGRYGIRVQPGDRVRRGADRDHGGALSGGQLRGAGTQRGKPAPIPRRQCADRPLEQHAAASRGYASSRGYVWSAPARRKEPAAAPLVAAAGAGVARRLPGRGGCRRFRRDRFQRAHAHPGSVPGGTDFLSGGIQVQRTGLPCRVWLLVCFSERLLVGERSIVIIPGRISVGERVYIRIRACLLFADRIRVPEPPFVRLPVSDPDLGLAYIQGPDADADADHISTDIGAAEHTGVFGIRNLGTRNFATARIHVGEHSIICIGTCVCVAAPGEKGQYVALDARRHSPGSCLIIRLGRGRGGRELGSCGWRIRA